MALLDATTFSFAGRNCREFGLRMAWFAGDLEVENETGLAADLVTSEMNLVRHRVNLYGSKPADVLRFSFALIRSDGTDISRSDSKVINNWLCDFKGYKKLQFDGEVDMSYRAVCTEVIDVVYQGLAGKKVTFLCDSIYGYSRELTYKATVEGEKTFKLYNYSDSGICYPTITLTATSDVITISNNTDNRSNMLNFSALDDRYVKIDNELSRVTDKDGKLLPIYKIQWGDYWIRLLPGANEFTVTGDCKLQISCVYFRKEGVI